MDIYHIHSFEGSVTICFDYKVVLAGVEVWYVPIGARPHGTGKNPGLKARSPWYRNVHLLSALHFSTGMYVTLLAGMPKSAGYGLFRPLLLR